MNELSSAGLRLLAEYYRVFNFENGFLRLVNVRKWVDLECIIADHSLCTVRKHKHFAFRSPQTFEIGFSAIRLRSVGSGRGGLRSENASLANRRRRGVRIGFDFRTELHGKREPVERRSVYSRRNSVQLNGCLIFENCFQNFNEV